MIYPVKGISGYVWGEHGCVRVCAGVRRCSHVCMCSQVCAGVRGDAQVCAGVHGCGSVQKGGCAGVHGCVHVCGMNFQNFFRRIADFNMYPIRILIII